FARFLALPPAEVENAKIVALVHDAGMRLLDYERLYRKPHITEEELSFLREHPAVGAAMAEPLLGAEVARAVLCHHERADGRGYPNELRGDEIPLLARRGLAVRRRTGRALRRFHPHRAVNSAADEHRSRRSAPHRRPGAPGVRRRRPRSDGVGDDEDPDVQRSAAR